MKADRIEVMGAPEVSGLYFRHFRGEEDHSSLAAVISGSDQADGQERSLDGEDIAYIFANYLTNCDPYSDIILAEVNGQVVGYGRCWWEERPPTLQLYKHSAFLLPAWRRKGFGRSILGWLESRLREIAKKHSRESDKFFQVNLNQSQTGAVVLIEQSGYQPVRHFDLMVRPDLMDLPNYPLPEGLEVRPVEEQHYRAIWHVVDETSKEEWGYSEPTEEDYQAWLAHPHFQPHLWQVAWDTAANRVIGTVLTYINQAENEQFNQLRGYTEGLGILPEWRRQGVARALISLSLQAQKDAGMHESALVADGLSPFGLTGLYESCGFKIVNRDTVYQKKL